MPAAPRSALPICEAGPIAVTRQGSGPEIVLVHGGASAMTTWQGLESLAARWTLTFVHRRGYAPSPASPAGQDFDVDAADLTPLMAGRPHVVAHSWGTLGALIAATRTPMLVRSLTLIEPPLFFLLPDDPEVVQLEQMGNAVLTDGLDTDPATLREFLRIAGVRGLDEGRLPEEVADAVRRAQSKRLPRDARPAFDAIRDAGVPVLVASGAHWSAIERISDALADVLEAERVIAPGANHFVAAAPGFADQLAEFLLSVD